MSETHQPVTDAFGRPIHLESEIGDQNLCTVITGQPRDVATRMTARTAKIQTR